MSAANRSGERSVTRRGAREGMAVALRSARPTNRWEVAISDWSGPPFRADHIGSLLRPPDLLEVGEKHRAEHIV